MRKEFLQGLVLVRKWAWFRPSIPKKAPPFPEVSAQDGLEIELKRWSKGYVLGMFLPQDLSSLLRPLTLSTPSLMEAMGKWVRKSWRILLAALGGVIAFMGLLFLLDLVGLFVLMMVVFFLAPILPVIFADSATRRISNREGFRRRLMQALDFLEVVGPHLEPGGRVGIFASLEYPHKQVKIPRLSGSRRSVWMDEQEVLVLEFPLKSGIQGMIRVSRTEIYKRARRWNQSSRMNLRVSLRGCHEGAQAVADSETGREWNLRCDRGNWVMDLGRRWKCPTLWEDGPIREAMLQALSEALQRIRGFTNGQGGWTSPAGTAASTEEGIPAVGAALGGVALVAGGASSFGDEGGGFVFDDLLAMGNFLGEAAQVEEFDMGSNSEFEESQEDGGCGDLESESYDSSESSDSGGSDDSGGTCSESEDTSSDRSDT
ncbi:MAG: hypothetical protein IPK50_00990 [Fibrobacterota bacterium]|nr:hypothetical protein [Fibrobacterota bacterium]QQS05489.1 MAG: hypothetical protein IPK50_00990 [Fibrobacterota bacterium]